MNKAEFDRFAEEYQSLHAANIGISGEDPDYFAEYKIRDLAFEYQAKRGHSDRAVEVLDFGAGIGTSVPFIRRYLPSARLTCLDVSSKSIEIGESRFPGQASFVHFDGARIPFPDAAFHIAFAACVFHHIDHQEHVALFQEIRRVLVPDGIALIYEHNPFNPLTVHAVNTCPFDENAKLVSATAMRRRVEAAGFSSARARFRIFFPRSLRSLRPLERFMKWLPLGAQYYVLAVR